MPYPRIYDHDAIKADWDAGLTTVEIGKKYRPHATKPCRYISEILRKRYGIDLAAAKRRKRYGPYAAYPEAEKALWVEMRPTMTVMQIVNARRAAGVDVKYCAVYIHCLDLKGPMGVGQPLKAAQRLEIKRLYQLYGWHLNDIAARFGKHPSTVRKYAGAIDGLDAPARPRQPQHLVKADMKTIADAALALREAA